MPKPSEIRDRFKNYVGEERYAKIVRQLPMPGSKARLSYGKERTWNSFVAENPDCNPAFSQVIAIFADCPIHGAKVRQESHLDLLTSWHQDVLPIEVLERRFAESEPWLKLKAQIQDGDEFRKFHSPPETWARRAGCSGIALVRNNRAVDCFVMVRN